MERNVSQGGGNETSGGSGALPEDATDISEGEHNPDELSRALKRSQLLGKRAAARGGSRLDPRLRDRELSLDDLREKRRELLVLVRAKHESAAKVDGAGFALREAVKEREIQNNLNGG